MNQPLDPEQCRLGLEAAAHFFDSPASFSDEEFQAVAEAVYAALGRPCKYLGKVPHLAERCLAEDVIRAALEEL